MERHTGLLGLRSPDAGKKYWLLMLALGLLGSSPHPSTPDEDDSQTELLIAEEKLSPEDEGHVMPRYNSFWFRYQGFYQGWTQTFRYLGVSLLNRHLVFSFDIQILIFLFFFKTKCKILVMIKF